MILHVLRALFVLLMAAAGWAYLEVTWLAMALAMGIAILFVLIDVLAPRKKLAIFSGTFFGLLVGTMIAFALSFVVPILVDQGIEFFESQITGRQRDTMVQFADVVLGIICSYLSISFILQTKDDFRFIIPYVEFSKQRKGARPFLLDTSVLVDGRIAEIADTGLLESQLVVPRFVLDELQLLADSADRQKRSRGRRGLDIVSRLQRNRRVDVVLFASPEHPAGEPLEVDKRLIDLAVEFNARVLTHDNALNKIAQLRGVDVININDLANSVKPTALPGDRMSVRLVKAGEGAGQGVGYLEDGTMIVLEQARTLLGEEVEFVVTSSLQTSAGRMIFGKLLEDVSPSAGGTAVVHPKPPGIERSKAKRPTAQP